jgi:hypothetical protein
MTTTIETYEMADGTKVLASTNANGFQLPVTFERKPLAVKESARLIASGIRAEVVGRPRRYLIQVND